MDDNDSESESPENSDDEELNIQLVFPMDDEDVTPIEEDDITLPVYDTDNRHSYLYENTGPVTFINTLMCLLDGGQELNDMHTTFHSFPLNIGDEVPYLKLDENDNRSIRFVIQDNSYLISINAGDEDSYEVTCWLRDRSKANQTSMFPCIDAVALQVVSYATKEDNNVEKTVAVCRVVGRVQINRVEKSLTGLIFSRGTVISPYTVPSYEVSTLSRTELALSPRNRERCLQHLLAANSRLLMHYATSASIDRLFSVLTWIPSDILNQMKQKPLWQVATFFMRAFPIDRKIHYVLNLNSSIDAQISILDSIDYSTVHGVCANCQHELFKMSDLVFLKPWVSSAIFVNPAEFMFDTVILRHTISPPFGALDESFSWFSGYGWRYLMCYDECRVHLGWKFESKTLRPSKFSALPREKFSLRSDEIDKILDQYYHRDANPTDFFRHQLALSRDE